MTYNKTNWVDGVTPVSAQNMNKLETQYDKAKELVDTHKAETATEENLGHMSAEDKTKLNQMNKNEYLGYYTPSDMLIISDNDVRVINNSNTSTFYAFDIPHPGEYRISFELQSDAHAGRMSYMRYRIGGSGQITMMEAVSYPSITSWTTFIYDVFVPPGGLVVRFERAASGYIYSIRNFKICGTKAEVPAFAQTS